MKSLCHQKYLARGDMVIMLKYLPSSIMTRYMEARFNSGKKIQSSLKLIVFSEDPNPLRRVQRGPSNQEMPRVSISESALNWRVFGH